MIAAEIILVFIILFIGSFIQGVSGFGFGLFSMSLLPFIFSLKDSTLLVLSLAVITSFSILMNVYKYIDVRRLLIILSAGFAGRIFAFFILHYYGDMDVLKKALGAFLILMVLYIFLKKEPVNSERKVRHWFSVSLGFIGGFIGGVFAVGGPFFVFYFLMVFKDKYAYNANLQVAFLFMNLFTLAIHGIAGDFTSSIVIAFLVGFIGVIVGSRLGMMFFHRFSQQRIRKAVGIIVALAGVNLMLF